MKADRDRKWAWIGILYAVMSVIGLFVHLWTTYMAYIYKGAVSAGIAFVCLFYAEGIWANRLMHTAPVYAWIPMIWLVLYMGIYGWFLYLKKKYPNELKETDTA